MTPSTIRTAEFVLPGHPDKLADAIADAIVQHAMRLEKRALVGIEVALYRNVVFIDGRVACKGAESIDFKSLVKDVYASAGYNIALPPAPHRVQVKSNICLGPLWRGEAKLREVADDQSIVTGFACSTPGTHGLPVEHALVRHLGIRLATLIRQQPDLRLGPDGKLIVLLRESQDGMEWNLERVSISIQHPADWDSIVTRRAIAEYLRASAEAFAALVPGLEIANPLALHVNEAGDFVEGGPYGDNGLSGKKLVADFYGPRVPIGGGAMSGKDFWKADRAGPLIAREIALSAVQQFGCKQCTVTLAIFPGDRAFRITHAEASNGQAIDVNLLASVADLRLCSQVNWPRRAGDLVQIARWGHFARLPSERSTHHSLLLHHSDAAA